jgi:hypothetical protein
MNTKYLACFHLAGVFLVLPLLAQTETGAPTVRARATPPRPVVVDTTRSFSSRKPAAAKFVEAEAEAEMAASSTLNETPDQAALEAQIARAKKVLSNFQRGVIVVGRVVLDGPGDPRDVDAQMPILKDGYFAGEVNDLVRPIGFRLHQYAPVDVPLKGRKGSLVDLGTIHMVPTAPADLSSLKGKIALEGESDPTTASLRLSVKSGPVNTPHNGTSARAGWPAPIRAGIGTDGTILAAGLSPIEYSCLITAPGFVGQRVSVTFKPGIGADLGVITLEKPKQIQVAYVVASQRPFDLTQKEQATLSGGERWKATPGAREWDLEFKQEAGKVFFTFIYGPCYLQNLGAGQMEDFVETLNSANPRTQPWKTPVQSGHVYLCNRGQDRWIAMRVELK